MDQTRIGYKPVKARLLRRAFRQLKEDPGSLASSGPVIINVRSELLRLAVPAERLRSKDELEIEFDIRANTQAAGSGSN